MAGLEFNKELSIKKTTIPGLLIFDLPVHGDTRGWFKENWQREKMVALGLPDFGPVQNNISFNAEPGVTRGIHAEPWDKFISIASGKIFGAWVDLREGDSFGQVFTAELDPSMAIFVPSGVGNAFQALEPNTAYTYLVNDHWSADAQELYTFLNLADETVNISWPIGFDQCEISDKDKNHPRLQDVKPMPAKQVFVVGGNGQLGTALRKLFPSGTFVDRGEFDITDPTAYQTIRWQDYSAIINAAAYTNVDGAETSEGKALTWQINANAVALLASTANNHNIPLVHISSDYVFDGSKSPHTESEGFAPLSVYGQTKAAGDIAASQAKKHYILRTSWVIGEGKNFVKTMGELAKKDVKPNVVNDQVGRLTFTADLAKAISHLLTNEHSYGTYNVTNGGEPASWADIAKIVYQAAGKPADDVTGVSTAQYYEGKEGIAPRPLSSELDLTKIKDTGFKPRDWQDALEQYLTS